jgi:hypothetical protein
MGKIIEGNCRNENMDAGDDEEVSQSSWDLLDRFWWDESRGQPPLHVVVGVWLFTAAAAVVVMAVVTVFVAFLFSFPCLWLGILDEYDARFFGTMWPALFVIGFTVSAWCVVPVVRPAISVTRLRIELRDVGTEEGEQMPPNKG